MPRFASFTDISERREWSMRTDNKVLFCVKLPLNSNLLEDPIFAFTKASNYCNIIITIAKNTSSFSAQNCITSSLFTPPPPPRARKAHREHFPSGCSFQIYRVSVALDHGNMRKLCPWDNLGFMGQLRAYRPADFLQIFALCFVEVKF